MRNLSALLQILIENKAYYLKTKSGLTKLSSVLTFYFRPSFPEKWGNGKSGELGNPGIAKSGDSEIRGVLNPVIHGIWESLSGESVESSLNLNKTPAKAFTPPAKRKWAQGQAGL